MNKYLIRRYFLFLCSLCINAFGVAFITKALLGTSPITSVTYVLSMFTTLSMGEWTIIVNTLFVVLELPLMSRSVLKADLRQYLLQIPISVCFGLFIDWGMNSLFWVNPAEYFSQVGFLLLGCVVLAAGISLEVKANVAMTSGEYFVQVISRRFRKDFGYVKLGFDTTLVLLACVFSLCFMSTVDGVREGTVVAALVVGPIVHLFTPYCRVLDKWLNEGKYAPAGEWQDTGNIIITIAREYGSGGHLLGEMLSRKLGIKLYDKEFIHLAAAESGMDEAYILRNEQSIPSFWLKCILSQNGGQASKHNFSADDILYVAENRVILNLARKESCIIVGRCADFVLRDFPHVIKVFCYSDVESACRRCVEEYGVRAGEARNEIRRINHNRVAHYEFYTGGKWGDPHYYDLMINTGSMTLETACDLVGELYRRTGISKAVRNGKEAGVEKAG